MTVKKLEVLEGTDYEVVVERTIEGDYTINVYKPAADNDPFATVELVAARTLEGRANKKRLNLLVQEIISEDEPTLVGTYKGVEETIDNNHE